MASESWRKGQIFTRLYVALREQQFLVVVRGFVAENMASFQDDAAPESGEHRLEWTELHGRYRSLFEAQTIEVLDREQLERSEVVELCESVTGGAPDGGPLASFLTMAAASEDYQAFVAMMRRGAAPWAEPEAARSKILGTLLSALHEPRFMAEQARFVAQHYADFAGEERVEGSWAELHRAYCALYVEHRCDVLAREELSLEDFEAVLQTVRQQGSAEAQDALAGCLAVLNEFEDLAAFVAFMRAVAAEVLSALVASGAIVAPSAAGASGEQLPEEAAAAALETAAVQPGAAAARFAPPPRR